MTAGTGDIATQGQLERGTPLTCRQCGSGFQPRNRNGVKKQFCSTVCKDRWKNGQRLRGAALLKVKATAVQRPRKTAIRTLDQLTAAQGLPSGCYPAGALGRRSVAAIIPAAERLGLLVEAAQRLGLTNEGPVIKAARLAAAQKETVTLCA